ncbi:hypothetical protein OPV22_023982 [Ensete ventricosum]|uniref:Uncharacterized protein n=1 Tax=Ensete ventricosum TaxID=4639 RepID=A0AAV8QPS8_ENSVE|nr:hypothetical protein OPV22_023982 [Ensete ventricosum]RWV88067.1 hypothetical protein GW17_00049881 [Ensete ventricosum]RWW52466.1 hypothetical protein BHE74_00041108 [Ensete ventricosum]RZS21426.1 hypothetical protein BHM03_00054065 [Ensete ventricosum]
MFSRPSVKTQRCRCQRNRQAGPAVDPTQLTIGMLRFRGGALGRDTLAAPLQLLRFFLALVVARVESVREADERCHAFLLLHYFCSTGRVVFVAVRPSPPLITLSAFSITFALPASSSSLPPAITIVDHAFLLLHYFCSTGLVLFVAVRPSPLLIIHHPQLYHHQSSPTLP